MDGSHEPTDDDLRVCLSRGIDLMWRAKRITDGEIVAAAFEKIDARSAAIALGYTIE